MRGKGRNADRGAAFTPLRSQIFKTAPEFFDHCGLASSGGETPPGPTGEDTGATPLRGTETHASLGLPFNLRRA